MVGSEVVNHSLRHHHFLQVVGLEELIISKNKADKVRDDNIVEIVNMDYDRQETIVDALNGVDKLFLRNVTHAQHD